MTAAATALEQEGIATDPLEVVASMFGSELVDWSLLGAVTGLKVFALGLPMQSLILCYDRNGQRDCVRLNMDGKELARVIGRVGPAVPTLLVDVAGYNNVDGRINDALSALDRIGLPKNSSEVR